MEVLIMKKKLFVIIIVFVIVISVMFNGSKDRVLVKYNGNNLRVSVNGNKIDKLPSDGNYYLASYTCKNKSTKVSWDRDKHELNVTNGNHKGSVSCYLEFETYPKISMMKIGSYVKYAGNNGCSGDKCLGKGTSYCDSKDNKYLYDGYRIAYVGDRTAYLISAGAIDCADNIDKINDIVLKYCNKNYVLGGVCNSNVVWGINSMDFKMITNSGLSDVLCVNSASNKQCGYDNDLLDIGGNYYILVNNHGYGWNANKRLISDKTEGNNGVRPIIRLDSNVIVTGGEGTYNNPYVISNNTFWVNDGNNII